MVDDHSALRENIPAYALGALDAEEAASLQAHLQTCETCREELAGYRALSDGLLAAMPPRQPSPALRRRLQGRLPGARKAPRPRISWSWGGLTAGAAFLLLLALSLFSLTQLRQINQQQAALLRQARTDQAALAMLSYTSTQALAVNGGQITGTLLLNRDHNTAMLITWDMPQLPANRTYQVWFINPNGGRVSGGIFRPDSGGSYTAAMLWPEESLSAYTGLGVTIEPAGGSPQPTGQRVLKVDF